MHSAPASSSEYHKRLDEALHDEFLRRTLDTFAVSYRESRAQVFKEVDERGLIKKIADAKDYACQHMDELYEQFKGEAEKRGVQVHIAKDAEEARHIIAQIARKNNVKYIVKSKSMTAEEIELNPDLMSDTMSGLEKLTKSIEGDIASITGIHAKVLLVEPRSLPRSEGKMARVVDSRFKK